MASSTGNIKSDEENSSKCAVKDILLNGDFLARQAFCGLSSLMCRKVMVKKLYFQALGRYFSLNFGKMRPEALRREISAIGLPRNRIKCLTLQLVGVVCAVMLLALRRRQINLF